MRWPKIITVITTNLDERADTVLTRRTTFSFTDQPMEPIEACFKQDVYKWAEIWFTTCKEEITRAISATNKPRPVRQFLSCRDLTVNEFNQERIKWHNKRGQFYYRLQKEHQCFSSLWHDLMEPHTFTLTLLIALHH